MYPRRGPAVDNRQVDVVAGAEVVEEPDADDPDADEPDDEEDDEDEDESEVPDEPAPESLDEDFLPDSRLSVR